MVAKKCSFHKILLNFCIFLVIKLLNLGIFDYLVFYKKKTIVLHVRRKVWNMSANSTKLKEYLLFFFIHFINTHQNYFNCASHVSH